MKSFILTAGTGIRAVGLMCCLLMFSVAMIEKKPSSSPAPRNRCFHDIERRYPVVRPGPVFRFRKYTPFIMDVAVQTQLREVTAYNAGDLAQCSDDPCISASGENLCETLALGYRRCAANFVPLGTRLHIDTLGEYVVVDRMHQRFSDRVDIAMMLDEKEQAKAFGVQRLRVTILDLPPQPSTAAADSPEAPSRPETSRK